MRDRVVYAVLLLVLAAFLGLAWLSRNPDAEILQRAAGWRWVGPWAERFRDVYRPPRREPAPAGEVEIIFVDRHGGVVDDAPSANDPDDLADPDYVIGARRVVWVTEGTPILAEPAAGSAEVARTGAIANLRFSERRGDWYRVSHREVRGWVLLESYGEGDEPPLGSDPLPLGPLEALAPDPDRLAFARARLDNGGVAATIGPYTALLDQPEPELVAFLDRLVGPLEELYADRYGLAPIGAAAGAIVLFRRHEDFLAYQRQQTTRGALLATGVAGHGIVAMSLAGQERVEIAATAIHEIVHLLNRRALGPALPAWLEEGLADGLAFSRVDAKAGVVNSALLGGVAIDRPHGWEVRGARASAIALRRAVDGGKLVPLERLLAMEWEEFVGPGASEVHYPQAAFWVRYLLEDADRTERFRGYLAGIAVGGSSESEELRRRLDREWSALDGEFARWVTVRFREPS